MCPGGSTMFRLRNARRFSLLAAPILAAVSAGLLTLSTALPGSAATENGGSKGEWFRAEPPRSPADVPADVPAAAPAAAPAASAPAEASDLGAAAATAPAEAPAAPAVAAPVAPAPAGAPLIPPAAPPEAPRRPAVAGNFPGTFGTS